MAEHTFGLENWAPYSEIQPLPLKKYFFSSALLAFNQRNCTEVVGSQHFFTVPHGTGKGKGLGEQEIIFSLASL